MSNDFRHRPADGETRWKAAAYSLFGAVSFLVVRQVASAVPPDGFDLLPDRLEVAEAHVGSSRATGRGIAAGTVFINFWDTLRKTMIGFAGAVSSGCRSGS